MTKKRSDVVGSLITRWQDRLRLGNWSIYLSDKEQPSRSCYADVYIRPHSLTAEIAIDDRVDIEDIEYEVLHEMLEVLFSDLGDVAMEMVDNHVPEGMRDVYKERLGRGTHQIIYRLETAFLGKERRGFDVFRTRPEFSP